MFHRILRFRATVNGNRLAGLLGVICAERNLYATRALVLVNLGASYPNRGSRGLSPCGIRPTNEASVIFDAIASAPATVFVAQLITAIPTDARDQIGSPGFENLTTLGTGTHGSPFLIPLPGVFGILAPLGALVGDEAALGGMGCFDEGIVHALGARVTLLVVGGDARSVLGLLTGSAHWNAPWGRRRHIHPGS